MAGNVRINKLKLYSTTTSERASKGQGGNEYLDIEILGENKGVIGKIRVEATKEYYSIVLGVPYRENGVISRESARRIQKGKSQKGEDDFRTWYPREER